ncbi:gas vesicle protein GvpN (plasmid) [Tundrisphaera lichenicola]|uniref:gas vesicle protein GvpN n=1 Tax=Tundrisphaera lichenicola TaxID=2029860 RepID=UPI003EB95692
MNPDDLNVLSLKQRPDFVQTPCVMSIAERALSYLQAGYPVHFSGPAGTGKTTMAMHVAAQIGRPVVLIQGDDEFGSSDLIGGQLGYRSTRVVDNFIHSVMKTEENVSKTWVDHRLTNACKFGFTVIYDEFNRSRPEANNVLLGVLEERLLEMPIGRSAEGHLQVHPLFRAIFTSNPEEYAGTHKTQDALLDRMITITVGHQDSETEAGITAAKSGLNPEDAAKIVRVVRDFRTLGVLSLAPTVRACIMIARIVVVRGATVACDDRVFAETCRDVLRVDSVKITHEGAPVGDAWLEDILTKHCPPKGSEHEPTFVGASNGHRIDFN